MNVKQRALNIWESYYKNIPNMSVKDATQCAIIYVKGIVEVLDIFPRHQMTPSEIERLDYWNEVLTELNQM